MRFILVGLMCIVAVTAVAANVPQFDSQLSAFKVTKPTILWDVPTKRLGTSLWVYKVVPQTFPVKAINQLLHMGGFTNRVRSGNEAISIINSSNTCNLIVIPAQGCIEYWDGFAAANHWDKTNHLWEAVEGLPSQSNVERLGIKLLKQFGIKRADLAQQLNGHLITYGGNTTRSHYNRLTGKYIENEITTRGIFFSRRIDNVNFAGIGLSSGCEIEFGNHANISNFKLVWRNLQPYERYKVASPDEIEQFILDDKAVLTHKNVVGSGDVKSITITDIFPLYMGAEAKQKQDFVYPFAKIDAIANIGNTNVGIGLYCPILSTNVAEHPHYRQ